MRKLDSISFWLCVAGLGSSAWVLGACGGGVGSNPGSTTGGSAGAGASAGSGALAGNAGSGGHAGSVANGGSGGSAAGGSGGTTSSGGAAGSAGCATSPSGYACDPWSVFLYPSDGAHRSDNVLRFQVHHDVDLEGNPTDEVIAPGHDFSQVLTIDIELTPEVRSYLCSVLVAAPTSVLFDPSAPDFATTVSQNIGANLLSPLPNDFYAHPENVLDICGAGPLATIVAPALVSTPMLPDIVLVLPLEPKPTDFKLGDTFSAWLARGIMWVDEESELTPPVKVTIAEIL